MIQSREVAGKLLLALASVFLFVLAAEAALRVSGLVPERFARTGRMADARWTLLLDCYPTNPRSYFDIDLRAPENRERYLHVAPRRYDAVARRAPWAVEFRYNPLKFRERPFTPKRAGVRRVMVLGDSFTEGQGVKEPDTFVRRLEERLNAAEPGKWEVLNCGRRGTDFPALFEAFEEILPWEPDIVVYAMVLNDADQSKEFHARQTYLNDWILDGVRMAQTTDVEPEPGFFSSRLATFVEDRIVAYRVGHESTRWYLEMYGAANREGWEHTQRYIREMDRRMRERGGAFLLAVWPLLVDLEGRYPFEPVHETIGRFCAAWGIARLDLLDVFRGKPTAPLWVHPVDRHPNETAHRMAAEALLPVVRGLAPHP
jgi:lysophospholipase L1-like esterase